MNAPPSALTDTETLALAPALMLTLDGLALIEKSIAVPLSEIDCGLPAALSEMLMAPFDGPLLSGANATEMVQLACPASGDVQLFVCVKDPFAEMLEMLRATSPVFERVAA